jgi:hypothetical protein
MVSNNVCPHCGSPLMKIDRYGEVLIGCIDCNRWGHSGDKKLTFELLCADLSVCPLMTHSGHSANPPTVRRSVQRGVTTHP